MQSNFPDFDVHPINPDIILKRYVEKQAGSAFSFSKVGSKAQILMTCMLSYTMLQIKLLNPLVESLGHFDDDKVSYLCKSKS